MKTKKKPAPTPEPASPLVPSKPVAPHVQQAVDRALEHDATAPPGISLKKGENGFVIDTDPPGAPNGMVHLMDAIGTHDLPFFTGYLAQIVNATTQGKTPDATTVNAALGFIRSINPRDPTEACLAAQMAATHNAVMTFARRLNHTETIPQQDSAINGYNKLARTFAAQMEALKRYRSTGEQKVTVQHVTVSDGGQAIVGGTVTAGGGGPKKEDTTP
jgi:hypothetical protein